MQHEPAAATTGTCPACLHPPRAGARFCKACGRALTTSTPAPEQTAPDAAAAQARFAREWEELRRIAWLYGSMLMASFAGGAVSRFDRSPWPGAFVSGFDAALTVTFAAMRPHELRPLLRFPRVTVRDGLRMLWVSLGFMALIAVYFSAMERVGVPFGEHSQSFREAGWPVWSMFLIVSVMPAVFEELAFRGVIQSSLERVFSGPEPWLIQAALFGVVHLTPLIFPSHVCLGLWLGWLRNRSGSLYPGMIAHAAWNAGVLSIELYGT